MMKIQHTTYKHCTKTTDFRLLAAFYQPLSRTTWVSRYHQTILDVAAAKDGGVGGSDN